MPRGQVRVSRRYLTIWGVPQDIVGYVKCADEIVWSAQGNHYLLDGTNKNGRHALVMTDHPGEELRFWQRWLYQIKEANSKDRLKLVAEGLENIQKRINQLKKNAKSKRTPKRMPNQNVTNKAHTKAFLLDTSNHLRPHNNFTRVSAELLEEFERMARGWLVARVSNHGKNPGVGQTIR